MKVHGALGWRGHVMYVRGEEARKFAQWYREPSFMLPGLCFPFLSFNSVINR